MIWLLALLIVPWVWLLIERHRRIRLERTRQQAISEAVSYVCSVHMKVIAGLNVRFALRARQLQAEFERQRTVDLVEHFDRGLFVHKDGHVSQLGDEIGRC